MSNPTNDVFAQIALDALLHGLRYLRDAADRTIHEIEHSRNGATPPRIKKQARALLEAPLAKPGKRLSGWSTDPEERRREMLRRQKVARDKRAGKRKHKDKEAWRENVRKAAKARWANLPAAQRKAEIARMQAGRRKAA